MRDRVRKLIAQLFFERDQERLLQRMGDEVILVAFHDSSECPTKLFLGKDSRQCIGSSELFSRERLYELSA